MGFPSRLLSRLISPFRHRPIVEAIVATRHLGSDYGGWRLCLDLVPPSAVVYSLGVGEDITFDLALIEETNAEVFAFDPTPKAVAWVERAPLPDRFHFFPWGVAAFDGNAAFRPPPNPHFASFKMVSIPERGAIELPVRRLKAIMETLEHDHIDVLKMDIEGAEFEVLPDMIRCGIEVDQLLVEVHGPLGLVFGRSWRLLSALRRAGYRMFAVTDHAREWSLLREAGCTATSNAG